MSGKDRGLIEAAMSNAMEKMSESLLTQMKTAGPTGLYGPTGPTGPTGPQGVVRDPFANPIFGDCFAYIDDVAEWPHDFSIFLGLDDGYTNLVSVSRGHRAELRDDPDMKIESYGIDSEHWTYLGNCQPGEV